MENAYRLRDRQLNIRISEHEYQQIMRQFENSGKGTLREYIVEAAINGYVIHVDYSEMKNLAYEINRIGNNINQIAHKVNSTNQMLKADMDELQEDVDLIWRMMRKAFYQLSQ